MMRKSLSRRLESRTAFVGLLLVGALALTAVLAWQAFDAGRSHARAVQKALGEQTRFAAWEYAGNARDYLDGKLLYPGLDVVAQAGGKTAGAPMSLARVRALAEEKDWMQVEGVEAVFRIDLASGEVTWDPVDDSTAAWATAELPLRVRDDERPGWEPVMLPAPGGGALVYRFTPDDWRESRLIYGFRVGADGLDAPLEYAFTGSPLLPEALIGGRDNRAVFDVTVEDAAGRPVWRSPVRYPSGVEATDTVGLRYAGLRARVALNPDVAPELVIGGLPGSRLPLVATLLLLTAGLVAGAFYLLRQETELAQLRADFVSGVSHELRTPLAQIRMFSETLLLGRVRSAEEERRSLEIIVNESRRLSHQVDNVLLYSRAERHGMRADRSEVRLDRLLEDVVETFRPLAEASKNRLEFWADRECLVRVDGSLIRQALLNLLDNAVKYGPPGQTLRIGLDVFEGGVRLQVEDEGPGVPVEERERIWEPYFRLASDRESAVAGSGIGLSVVQDVARAHGGTARVEDRPEGRGARFVVELPAEVRVEGQEAPGSRTGARAGAKRGRTRAAAALRRAVEG